MLKVHVFYLKAIQDIVVIASGKKPDISPTYQ
jgi:hypothetical protein